MSSNANIFFEREDWKGPFAWSAFLHACLFAGIAAYAIIVGGQHGEDWGGAVRGEALSATLVSSARVPLPANPVETQNVLANQSMGISVSPPPVIQQEPQAVPIPEPEVKFKPKPPSVSRTRTPVLPPPEDNQVPFGQGGPVSGPYGTFSTNNAKGGFSFAGGGDFGSLYAWYVNVVRQKVAENWLKYEIDPNINAARRVYIVFDILRNGEPVNVQIEQSSGVPSLDQSAVRALQRIDSFGPLPPGYSGSKVSVEFWFDYKR